MGEIRTGQQALMKANALQLRTPEVCFPEAGRDKFRVCQVGPGEIGTIQDGPANTISFAEGYSQAYQYNPADWWGWNPNPYLSGPINRDWISSTIGYTADGSNTFQIEPKRNSTVVGEGPQIDLAQSYSRSGIMLSFFDGSARNVRTATPSTWYAVSTPNNSDIPGPEW